MALGLDKRKDCALEKQDLCLCGWEHFSHCARYVWIPEFFRTEILENEETRGTSHHLLYKIHDRKWGHNLANHYLEGGKGKKELKACYGCRQIGHI